MTCFVLNTLPNLGVFGNDRMTDPCTRIVSSYMYTTKLAACMPGRARAHSLSAGLYPRAVAVATVVAVGAGRHVSSVSRVTVVVAVLWSAVAVD